MQADVKLGGVVNKKMQRGKIANILLTMVNCVLLEVKIWTGAEMGANNKQCLLSAINNNNPLSACCQAKNKYNLGVDIYQYFLSIHINF